MTATSRRNSSDVASVYFSHEAQKLPVVKHEMSSESGSNLDYVQFLRYDSLILKTFSAFTS